jgi:hypothetical protein
MVSLKTGDSGRPASPFKRERGERRGGEGREEGERGEKRGREEREEEEWRREKEEKKEEKKEERERKGREMERERKGRKIYNFLKAIPYLSGWSYRLRLKTWSQLYLEYCEYVKQLKKPALAFMTIWNILRYFLFKILILGN